MPMKVAVLFSGGKDSTFTIYECLRKGYDVKYLIAMIPENPHSYMFHHPNVHLTELQAKSIGIPIIIQHTEGKKEEELKDLRKAIQKVRGDIDGVVAGGLASKYQADRIGKVCSSLGLKIVAPLWNIEPVRYWKMLLKAGFDIMIVSVSAEGLGREWLGRKIDWHAFRELKSLSKKFCFHLGFEGGEAETLVLDAPIFKKKLLVLEAKKEWKKDAGIYLIKDAILMDKKRFAGLMKSYRNRKDEIRRKLHKFRKVWNAPDTTIFAELCFCLCTPQSKAGVCSSAINKMVDEGILFRGNKKKIRDALVGVRFHNNKAEWIVEARRFFTKKGRLKIKEKIDPDNIIRTREWLVKNIKGLGYKEASHFLRNIGFGQDIAILDRHILKNLKRLGVIEEIPKSLSPLKYRELEKRVHSFSSVIGIPLDELDLLFWSQETGHVFK